jgi:hypothetical protein
MPGPTSNYWFLPDSPTYLSFEDVSGWCGSKTGADDLWFYPNLYWWWPVYRKRDYVRAERFWSPNYIQHSAHIASGREGLFNLIKSIPPDAEV